MANQLKKALTLLRAPANSLAFAARRRLCWQRGRAVLPQEDKAGLFDYLDPAARRRCERQRAEFLGRFDLAPLERCSSRDDYRENLALIDTLEQVLGGQSFSCSDHLRAVDVGCKNWNYVFGLERFWRHWQCPAARSVSLLGFEIDGHAVYSDLHSRFDHAQAYVEQTGNKDVEYRVQDFLTSAETGVDVVTIFYPFLTRYALLQWGLPLSCFSPAALIEKAVTSLRPGGRLIVFNQTAVERDLLHGILRDLGAGIVSTLPIPSDFLHYRERTRDRHATLAAVGGTPRSR